MTLYTLDPPTMDQSKWKHLISQHLGRNHVKRSWELMVDLLSVDCGLKPAQLLDFAVPSAECLGAFLQALKHSGLVTHHLTVVTIELDMLIINPTNFDHLTHCSKNPLSCVLFVDVSGSLDHPQLLSDSSPFLQPTSIRFLSALEKKNNSVTRVSLSAGEGSDHCANPSTLFGLFLGYPVVYYYDMPHKSRDNCLSMVPLVNFVLKGTIAESNNHIQHTKQHVILSFSVPQIFVKMAEKRVEDWFEEKKDCALQCKLFGKLDLERRVVQVPRVCL